jgi:hypothetical protein
VLSEADSEHHPFNYSFEAFSLYRPFRHILASRAREHIGNITHIFSNFRASHLLSIYTEKWVILRMCRPSWQRYSLQQQEQFAFANFIAFKERRNNETHAEKDDHHVASGNFALPGLACQCLRIRANDAPINIGPWRLQHANDGGTSEQQ